MRRFGTPPDANARYRRRPGVYAILPQGADLLVTFQGGIQDEFQLPGGGIEPGESPVAALHREVFEETGWHITRPRMWRRFKRFTYMPEYDMWAEKICTIYIAQPTVNIGPPLERDHTAVWMPARDAATELAVSGDRWAVAGFIGAGR